MTYWHALAALSLFFVVLERLRPRDRQQRVLRKGILTDAIYLVVNGHFLGVALALLARPIIARLDALLGARGLDEVFYANVAAPLPAWAQVVVALVVVDFLHWNVHRLLHRVPWLWELHKVHHSIVDMDWAGSMRFHWGEAVLYKSLTYPLLAFFGFSGEALLWFAVIATAVGHFNHSNLDVGIGPLRYLLNNPRMHVWHHAIDSELPKGRHAVNLGITLSLWDWIFGTAHVPSSPPRRLAFKGIERFPRSWLAQALLPLAPVRFGAGAGAGAQRDHDPHQPAARSHPSEGVVP